MSFERSRFILPGQAGYRGYGRAAKTHQLFGNNKSNNAIYRMSILHVREGLSGAHAPDTADGSWKPRACSLYLHLIGAMSSGEAP